MVRIVIVLILTRLCIIHSASPCPMNYDVIVTQYPKQCYKITNMTVSPNVTWLDARDKCAKDSADLSSSNSTSNYITHLLALEKEDEKNALFKYVKDMGYRGDFWIDGIFSTSSWDWSKQPIDWYFNEKETYFRRSGSNYKITFNTDLSTYQIADDDGINEKLQFICEYQELCNDTHQCENNATCYINLGVQDNTCICAPGFTGQKCETSIDECLSSPCLHGGVCNDKINNYTCNCSATFYTGSNCEIPLADPTRKERSVAFWSVVGIVSGLVLILTLSDLPWKNVYNTLGCADDNCRCCSKKSNNKNEVTSTFDATSKSKMTNYNVINAIWNPEHMLNRTALNRQYNTYRSQDESSTPDPTHIQSFSADIIVKHKEKESKDKHSDTVDVHQPTINSTPQTKDPVETMINWTQQLQDQLRNNNTRETSGSSTKKLIQSSNATDC